MQWVLMTVGGATILILGAIVWLHVQQQAAIERLDDRMAHLVAGVSLLTDTTESALRDTSSAIGRFEQAQGAAHPRARPTTQRRVTVAAKRGRAIRDIAASEKVSEGEVRLRLQLDKAQKERAHASVR